MVSISWSFGNVRFRPKGGKRRDLRGENFYANATRTNASSSYTTTRLGLLYIPFKQGLFGDRYEAIPRKEHKRNMTRINTRVQIKFPKCSLKSPRV